MHHEVASENKAYDPPPKVRKDQGQEARQTMKNRKEGFVLWGDTTPDATAILEAGNAAFAITTTATL